jgi:hypothetical protein
MNYRANVETTSSHMKWGLLAPATVILGGAGVVFIGGAQEAAQNGAPPWGVALFLVGGLAIWGFLALLYVLNWRAARVRAAMARNAFITPRKGGFLKGALIGTALVMALQVLIIATGVVYPGLESGVRQLFVLLAFYLTALYTVFPIVPLVCGWLGRVWRATSV